MAEVANAPAGGRAWSALAAPRWIVICFVGAGIGALAVTQGWLSATVAMLPSLLLLLASLLSAITTRPRFRADWLLLAFHLLLLVLGLLFVAGRMTYFDAGITLTQGQWLDPSRLDWHTRGPWHGEPLTRVRFGNDGFNENYPQRGKYHATYNRVWWQDGAGASHAAVIGDDLPLIIDGYRIYTTRHRGFSPVLRWQPAVGPAVIGTVQLRDQGQQAFAPTNEFTLPGGPRGWAMLQADAGVAAAGIVSDLGAPALVHELVIRIGEGRHVLRPGGSLALDGGRLDYLRLDSWMSYRVVRDETRPWLVATIALAVVTLIAFYWRKLAGMWDAD